MRRPLATRICRHSPVVRRKRFRHVRRGACGLLIQFYPNRNAGRHKLRGRVDGQRQWVPTMSANQNITVSVAELNSSPGFTSTAPTSANEGVLYTYASTVSDPDFPAQNIVCSINVSDTCGGSLAGCSYSFTPTESQGGTTCVVGLTVTDDGSPVLNATQNTTINILETNSAPSFTSTGSTTGTEGVPYSYAATVSDPDVPHSC